MYDFETLVDRKNCGSVKWNFMLQKTGGADGFPMWIADMDLKTAPEITEALIEKAKLGIYGYTSATPAYYDAVAGFLRSRHGWAVKKEWILPADGVISALYVAVKAFTHPGDKVILQSPDYHFFTSAVTYGGCEIVRNTLLHANGRYTMDFDDLEAKAADPRVKLLILCNPHNPSGRVWTKAELAKLGEICLKNDVMVISDEIHFDFVYDPHRHTVFANISEDFARNSITLTSPSKTFNLSGLEVANVIISNPKLRRSYEIAATNNAHMGSNYFGYAACETAYTVCDRWLDELLAHLERNRRLLTTFFSENLPQFPVTDLEGTYLAWVDFRPLGLSVSELDHFLKYRAGLFLTDGASFGTAGERFERINIACPSGFLEKALLSLKSAIDRKFFVHKI